LRADATTVRHLILIAAAGERASWRSIDFFTAKIRDPKKRRAYTRAWGIFLHWCDERGPSLETIRPFDVNTFDVNTINTIRSRQKTHSAPDVKQQAAAIRMLFMADHESSDSVQPSRRR
jgi:hypothetical protein